MRLISWMGIRPWLTGVLLSAAGMYLGYDLGSEVARLLGGEPGLLARIGKGFVWGGVIGALQWPVVRRAGVTATRFLAASAAGFAIGYPLGQTIQLMLTVHGNWHWTGYASALAAFGLCLGLLQWWACHQQVRRASLWIMLSAAGWMLSGATLTGPRFDVLNAGVYGIVTGLGLTWLVRSQRPAAAVRGLNESS